MSWILFIMCKLNRHIFQLYKHSLQHWQQDTIYVSNCGSIYVSIYELIFIFVQQLTILLNFIKLVYHVRRSNSFLKCQSVIELKSMKTTTPYPSQEHKFARIKSIESTAFYLAIFVLLLASNNTPFNSHTPEAFWPWQKSWVKFERLSKVEKKNSLEPVWE